MEISKAFFIFAISCLCHFLLPVTTLNAQKPSEYSSQINTLFDKAYGNLYSNNKDSSHYYFTQIKILSVEQKDWLSTIDASIGLIELNTKNNALNKVKYNLDFLDSLVTHQKSYLDTIPGIQLYKNEFSYQKSSYYFSMNDFEQSRNALNNIIKSTEALPDSLFTGDYFRNIYYLSTAYSYLAKMNSDEGKLDLAKQYYEKNIRFLNIKTPQDKQTLYQNYSLIAEVYKRQNDYNSANVYLMKTLDFNLKNRNKSSIASILNIAQNHIKLSQPDSATFYLMKAKSILEVNDPEMSSYIQVSAEIHQANEKYTLALNDFNKALKLTKIKLNYKKHWEIAHILNKIGLLQKQFGFFDKAIQSYDKAIDQLSISNSIINLATLLKIFRNKAEALNSLQRSSAYSSTIAIVNKGMEILNTLKPTFKSQADKLLLIEDVFPLFESGMEAAYNLYQYSKEEKYIELAFQYSEQSKAVLLMEALLGAKATEFANIPTTLLERENQLKSEITFYEKQINNTKENIGELEDHLFELREAYRQLVKKIETDYKTYYDLKYNTETISIDETQNLLDNDEQLISYFYGNDALFAISISKNSEQMERIELDASLQTDIKKIYELLRDPRSDLTVLNTLSFKLYTKLLAPFIGANTKKKLVIIADGLLNYIPFEALNTQPDGITYLAESFSISYANSTTLLSQLRQRNIQNPRILAFAPNFKGKVETGTGRAQLLPLPHNKKEVVGILTSFQGRSFVDENATLQNFKTQLGNFSILHLATHAIFNDTSPDDSYLAFAQNGTEENLLYVRDLYNLQTDADMVTLSACESGMGELRRGEGFLSLARGFFYSGASSICSTLWKINDASSTQLMDDFYKNLAEGDAKDLALQKAQIKFLNLNRQNALSHPYYWSGFVLSGNTEAVVRNHGYLWMSLGGIVLLIIGFVFFKNRKKDKNS